jgi:hypothetical protein
VKLPRIGSEAFQRGLVRTGTAVWLLAGIALLAATVRTQWPIPSAAASTAKTSPPAPEKAEAARPVYEPSDSIGSGDEIVLVFIGASFCNAHNVPGFPDVVESAKLRLQRHAQQGGMQFRAIGVALDWRAADGLAFLARFGEFDEVASGGNWTSDGATKYIWRDIPGDANVPQLLVLRRSVHKGEAIRVGEDQVVKRLLGTGDIEKWVAGGATL